MDSKAKLLSHLSGVELSGRYLRCAGEKMKEFLEIVLVVQDKILYKIVKEDSCLTIDREGMRKIGKGGGETWRKEREL
ncbi:hypothetical protein RUM44_005258 [Polyplax serrata]|uniref:Uncharacterized protein n=1 Tax=Polyplax serrata TaxID=468196 RepID=A0ABR1AEJ4_POLSC